MPGSRRLEAGGPAEELELDRKHTARIDLRGKYTRQGIIATTDPNVEPGYRGRLKIGLTNLSPHLAVHERVADVVTTR